MRLLESLKARNCPVCERPADDAAPYLGSSVTAERLGTFSFASRKTPEYMSFRLVRCRDCQTVFAAEAPGADELAMAYAEADYDSPDEAASAAQTYATALEPYLDWEDRHGPALEIGTGTGVFLQELTRLGFSQPIGVEPSVAAVTAAAPELRGAIRQGIFDARDFPPDSLSLVCCFMTLEHVPEPRDLVEGAFKILRPNGLVALVTHDYSALINRLLGRRSPIIDVEHMQLFCPASLRRLLSDAGFRSIHVERLRNVYPFRYWLRLAPLPGRCKALAIRGADAIRLGRIPVGADVGNLLAIARKPVPA